MEAKLKQLVDFLTDAAGGNLKAVVLYGSAVAGDFHAKHSNLNVLCVLERSDIASLEQIRPAVEWWAKQGHAAPLVFTLDELRASADIFAIELTDMKSHHRMLFGQDFFESIEVPSTLHRLQVERELRTNWLRLRQAVLTTPGDDRPQIELMLGSISSFVTLFRHALIAFGDAQPQGKRDTIARIAAACRTNASGFEAILDLRESKKKESEIDARKTLQSYVEFVNAVTNEVDRRFASSAR